MKKHLTLLMTLLAFMASFSACSKDDDTQKDKVDSRISTKLEAVNLGLPSGTRWCNMNVGATSPEGTGYYYAWGECEPKASYYEENYKYSERNIGKDIAGSAVYDVALKTLGEGWCMPSKAQFLELINSCTWEKTSLNGTSGYKVTGPNGNYIFLPAAGCYRSYEENAEEVNESGYYWSSTPFENDEFGAYYLLFSDAIEYNITSRSNGLTVRAVKNLSDDLPADRIWYTALNGAYVEPHIDIDFNNYGISTFGARIKSYGYDEERKMNYYLFEGPVTKIGSGAFRGISELTSIIIPNSVNAIEDEAFKGCTALTSATIGKGVKYIGMEAFNGCTSLNSIAIPDSVESIGIAAFGSCHSLVLATIGKGIKEIAASAFMECCDLGIHVIFTSPQAPELDSNSFFFIGRSEFETDFEYEILETFKRIIVPNEDYLLDVPSGVEDKEIWEHEHPWAFYRNMILVNPLSNGLDDIKRIAIEEINSADDSALDDSGLDRLVDYKVSIRQAETALEVFSIESDCLAMIASSFKQ